MGGRTVTWLPKFKDHRIFLSMGLRSRERACVELPKKMGLHVRTAWSQVNKEKYIVRDCPPTSPAQDITVNKSRIVYFFRC